MVPLAIEVHARLQDIDHAADALVDVYQSGAARHVGADVPGVQDGARDGPRQEVDGHRLGGHVCGDLTAPVRVLVAALVLCD